jgi:REP element-mobilizing transposase RayT
MPRPLRIVPGGFVYHVLNRANGRRRIFDRDEDYRAFERVLAEIQGRIPMRVLAWCLMPNHWHLVLWPARDGDLSDYMRLVTLTHTQRWHAYRATTGSGHLYQGRFKSFVVQDDTHFLTVCRYVEGNALRAKLVTRAEDWRWCRSVARAAPASKSAAKAPPVAGHTPSRLGTASKRDDSSGGDRSGASVRNSRNAIRPRCVDAGHGWTVRIAMHPAPAWTPGKRVLTPFSVFPDSIL